MSSEEKAVIDSFQGEKEYNKIMNNSDYYLAPVTNNQILRLEWFYSMKASQINKSNKYIVDFNLWHDIIIL